MEGNRTGYYYYRFCGTTEFSIGMWTVELDITITGFVVLLSLVLVYGRE